MIRAAQRDRIGSKLWVWPAVVVMLLATAYLGLHPSLRLLALLSGGLGLIGLLQKPILGFFALVLFSMVVPLEVGTGTEVSINLSSVLVPALLGLWLLNRLRQQEPSPVSSRVNRHLILFLFSGLLSLVIGTALWDPAVPRPSNLIIVQLAQWAIFAFSAGAFWLAGNQLRSQTSLRRLTFFYLAVAGSLGVLWTVSNGTGPIYYVATIVLQRAPFWMLLSAVACGQLFFNQELSSRWRWFLIVVLAATVFYSFFLDRDRSSNWVGVGTAIGALVWLRWPRLRHVLMIAALIGVVFFSSHLYQFAGGADKWDESGGSRLALIGRVVEVTMRNPITGLGPAAYRSYARTEPLFYQGAYWLDPLVNSHNNYVDLFAHMGLLGLGLFVWFAVELLRLGASLRRRYTHGFAAGYVNSVLAGAIASLVLMALADWLLPHVYNIGFPGFQASVLIWLFLGGLLAFERMARQETGEV